MKRLLPLFGLIAAPLLAHGGAHEVESGSPGWTLDPWVTLPLAALALAYAVGAIRLWQRSGLGRSELRRGALFFGCGWSVLAGAIVSPLHEAGERSFTMHMIEHELIMLVATLLLVASRPGGVLLWSLPSAARQALGGIGRAGALRALWRLLTEPVAATVLQGVVMWVWHLPPLFDGALGHQGWHVAQHLSFLLSSLLFWWAMMHGREGRHGYGVSALCLFATSLIGGALGALMAVSTSPWYAGYAAMGMTLGGLTPAEDQQLAGLMMWIPGGLFHAAAALWFLFKWLNASEASHAAPAR